MTFAGKTVGDDEKPVGSGRSIAAAWVAVGLIALLFVGLYGLAAGRASVPDAAGLAGAAIPSHASRCVEPPASLGLAPDVCGNGGGPFINPASANEPDL